MPEFVVESYCSGHPASVAALADELALAAGQVSRDGAQVRLLSVTLLPEEEICFYLFEAPSADGVREALAHARLRFERISEAVYVTPRRPTRADRSRREPDGAPPRRGR